MSCLKGILKSHFWQLVEKSERRLGKELCLVVYIHILDCCDSKVKYL